MEAYSKTSYVDANVALKVSKARHIMTGRLDLGGNRITGVYDPKSTKNYVDVLGSSIDNRVSDTW